MFFKAPDTFPQNHIKLNAYIEDWPSSPLISSLTAPWKNHLQDGTKFDYKVANDFLYFYFEVIDTTLITPPLKDEISIAQGDRVELFFSANKDLENYYCIEISPKGYVLDYQASYYRKFERTWNCKSLNIASRITQNGFIIEGQLSLRELNTLGMGSSLYLGLFRADFYESNKTDWYSWVIPNSKKPDFHIPSAFQAIEDLKTK
nr:sugar-binding protein [Aestuariivivens insulae]